MELWFGLAGALVNFGLVMVLVERHRHSLNQSAAAASAVRSHWRIKLGKENTVDEKTLADIGRIQPDLEANARQTGSEWASNLITALAVQGYQIVRLPAPEQERECVFCEQPFSECEKDPECGIMDDEDK